NRPGPEGDVDVGIELEEPFALCLRIATTDGDQLVRASALDRRRLGEMRGELLVGFLPDRAGVEDEDVRLFLRRSLPQSELLEHALDPLSVVSVHLAAERRDVVPPHGPECYPWSFRTRTLSGSSAWLRWRCSPFPARQSSTSWPRGPSRGERAAWPRWPACISERSPTSLRP